METGRWNTKEETQPAQVIKYTMEESKSEKRSVMKRAY